MGETINCGGWIEPRPGRLNPERSPVPIVQQSPWAPGPAWTGVENRKSFAPTGIRPPNRPARSQPLYRLRYLGPSYLETYLKLPIQHRVGSNICQVSF
jgi:hypothetical protein